MSWFGKETVEAVGGAVTGTIESIRFALTGDMPPEERVKLEELLVRMKELENKAKMGVIELANIDAKSSSKFQSWWRPLIGWVCAISLGMYFIPQYAMGAYVWMDVISSMTHAELMEEGLPDYPVSPDAILELVLAMLGMGAIRTAERFAGVGK